MTDIATLGLRVDSRDLAKGEVALDQFAREGERTETRVSRSTKKMSRDFVSANRSISASLGRNSFAVTNAANQFSDFAVQVQAGVPVSRALSQQLPQLTAMMGPLAAVLGVVGGLAAGAAGAFLNMRDEAESLDESLEGLSDVLDRIGTLGAQIGSVAELSASYGIMSERAREAHKVLRQMAITEAELAQSRVATGIAESFGGFFSGSAVENFTALPEALRQIQVEARDTYDETLRGARAARREFQALEGAVGSVVRELGLGDEAAVSFLDAVADARAADTAVGVAEAYSRARDVLLDAAANGYELSESARALLTDLTEAELAALRLSAVDFGNIALAASAAGQLAEQLGVSVAIASRMLSNGYQGEQEVVLDPRDPRYDPIKAQMARLRDEAGNKSPFAPVAQSAGASGGGAGSAAEQTAAMRAATSVIQQAQRAAVGFSEVQDLIEQQFKSGAISAAEYASAIEIAKERYTEAGEAAKFWDQQAQALTSGIVDAIIEGESLADTFRNIAKAIAKAALEAALFNTGPFASDSGGSGLLGALFGGIFGGARAGGGPIDSGKAYMVGERGPEMIVPRSAGTVIPTDKLPGGGSSVVINIDARGAQVGVAEQIEAALDRRMPSIVTAASAVRANRLSRGKSA